MSDSNTTYHHNFITGRIVPSGGLTDDATASIIRSESTTSPKGVLKSIRRRSRVSKKTPTTHLSANTSNFRALVQQFTGCPRPPFSHGSSQKGPINLSFGHRAHEDNNLMAPPSKHSHYTQQSDQPQPQPQQQLQRQEWCHQDQQQGLLVYHDQHRDMLSSDNVTSDDVFFSNITGNPRSSNMEVRDNFVAVNGNMNSGYYL